jgi:hypothetical protein
MSTTAVPETLKSKTHRLLDPLPAGIVASSVTHFSAYSGGAKGPHWFSVMKTTLNLVGPPVGDPQLPVQPLEMSALEELKEIPSRLGYKVQVQHRH